MSCPPTRLIRAPCRPPKKAVELDDTSAGAHNSLAFATFYWNWDPLTAEREYKRALELDPNFVQGHHWYATFLLANQRYPEALAQIEQARKLDPSSTTIQADKGLILNNSGHKSEAFALLKQLETTDPSLATTHTYLSVIYLERNDYEDFFAESRLSAQLRHDEVGLGARQGWNGSSGVVLRTSHGADVERHSNISAAGGMPRATAEALVGLFPKGSHTFPFGLFSRQRRASRSSRAWPEFHLLWPATRTLRREGEPSPVRLPSFFPAMRWRLCVRVPSA